MTISAFAAAKYLAERSDWSLTNLQMQKILYLAHMAHMVENNGQPLINSWFEAWEYGTVCPPLYHKLKIYGGDPVGNILHRSASPAENSPEAKTLEAAYEKLGGLSGGRLVALTHQQGGAWEKHWRQGIRGATIPNEDIVQEYRDIFA